LAATRQSALAARYSNSIPKPKLFLMRKRTPARERSATRIKWFGFASWFRDLVSCTAHRCWRQGRSEVRRGNHHFTHAARQSREIPQKHLRSGNQIGVAGRAKRNIDDIRRPGN